MKTKLLSIAIIISIILSACRGDDGPAGPQGATGANGSNGTNGTNGNTDVKLYTFGAFTLNSTTLFVVLTFPTEVTYNMIDSSLVQVGHQNSGCGTNWYLSPGLGCSAYYNTRVYFIGGSNPVQMVFEIEDPDGSFYSGAGEIIDKIKVIIAPADGYQGSIIQNPDDFESVLEYYHLNDNQ